MRLEETTRAVRRQAGCEVFGCVLVLEIIERSLVASHQVNEKETVHSVRFDQTQLLWETLALGQIADHLRIDHQKA